MRTLDAALTTAQQADTREPYVRIYLDDRDGTTYTYTTKDATNRIVYVEQWEEPYAGVALIRLSNYDGHFTAKDLRGYSVSVGWGMILDSTPDSTWYSNTAVMKVRMQRDISYEGYLVTELYCVSVWAELEVSTVLPAGKKLTGTMVNGDGFTLGETITGSNSGATGKLVVVGSNFIVVTRVSGTFEAAEDADGASASVDSISAPTDNYGPLVYASGDTSTEARIEALTGLTVDVDEDDPDDSMADTPYLAVEAGTSVRAIIRNMLLRTKCGARYENDSHLHVLYLDTSDSANYSFDANHAFFVDLRERAIILPNTVIFVDALPSPDGTAATYFGTANDATSVAAIGAFTTVIVDPDLASNAEAATRAAAWVAQQVAEAYQGQIVAPMECGLEVYDMVQAVDARLNVAAKGRIGRIERVFEPSKDVYEVRINLGSLYSVPGAMDTGPDSRDNDLRDLTTRLDKRPPKKSVSVLPWQLWKAVQPYTVDVDFTAEDEDTISWASGTIYFADGTSLSIDADASQNLQAGAGWIYFTEGSATLTYTQTYADCVAPTHGLVALVAPATIETGKSGAKALIIPFAGKVGSFNADVISCIYLAALTVDALVATFGGGSVVCDADALHIKGELARFYNSDDELTGRAGSIGASDNMNLHGIIGDLNLYAQSSIVLAPGVGDVVPNDTSDDLGNASEYWDDINYSDLIDRTPSPLAIAKALEKIKLLRIHKSTGRDVETFNRDSLPPELIVPVTQQDIDKAEARYQRRLADGEDVVKLEPQPGISMNATIGLLLSAIKELTDRVEQLEAK